MSKEQNPYIFEDGERSVKQHPQGYRSDLNSSDTRQKGNRGSSNSYDDGYADMEQENRRRQKGDKGTGKKKRKFPLWKNVFLMILLLAIFVGGAYWGSKVYTRHGQEVAVPNLKGLTVDQALMRLDALGLTGYVRDSVYNRKIMPGLICEQNISAGNYVKVGRVVGLTVNSDKAPTLVLPDVADNMSYREASAKLKSMGFVLTAPEYIDGEKDWVYSVKYKGGSICVGTRVDINEPITLVVGNGHYMMDEIEFNNTYGADSMSGIGEWEIF